MDFYIDIGFAVLLRILKDRRSRSTWATAFKKLYDAIGIAYNAENHHTFEVEAQPK